MTETEQQQRFDQSFVVQMIRDFFLALVVVVCLELAVRFVLVLYQFEVEKPDDVALAAERLAENVRSIMLNKGGPVAARTVYPIIRRNHEEIGLEIAIEPSLVTIESIRKRFDQTPQGIPADWPSGRFQEAREAIEAEAFCLQCHVTAGVGDVLGHVSVRSYLDRELNAWWHEVRFVGTLGMGKILVHTVVLFFLLRVRMEPLNSLKGVVSVLAKSGSRLTHRAPVKSGDEFGELARDLNLFLDRIKHVMEDLSEILSNIGELTERLTDVHERTTASHRKLDELARDTSRDAYSATASHSVLNPAWIETADTALRTLNELARPHELPDAEARRLDNTLKQFAELVNEAHQTVERNREIGATLQEFSRELQGSANALQQMAVLEERMRSISSQGQRLLERLRGAA